MYPTGRRSSGECRRRTASDVGLVGTSERTKGNTSKGERTDDTHRRFTFTTTNGR